MKAAVLKEPGRLAVEEVPDPQPGAGEVLLRVRDCGICGSDLHAAKQGLPPDTIMGHEFSGEIVKLGPAVSGWSVGERVVSLPYMSCGMCAACRAGDGIMCPQIRVIGLGQLPGAYAEFVRVQATSLLRVPDTVGDREAALVEPLAVGFRGVHHAHLTPGSSCLILGAGPIGLVTLLWARRSGAGSIVVSEIAEGRAALAQRLGATAVVNPQRENPAVKVQELTGSGPDVIFECIGVKGTLNTAMQMARPRGRIVVLGACGEMDEILPLVGIVKELEIKFVLGYSRAEFATALAALQEGTVDVRALVTDIITVADVPRAFGELYRPSMQGKVLIEFPSSHTGSAGE